CMTGVEVVHHLAAAFRQLNVPNSYYWDVNVEGTRNVLEAARRENVKKFVYCSTCGVHGNVDNPPGNEESPINAADYYQQTKYEAEPIVKEYQQKGMETTILRPAAIYGPGDPERFFMIFKRVNKGMFPMFGNGKTLYHPLYIDHLVDAHVLAQEPGKGVGEAYLIADEEYIEIETLVQKTAAALKVDVKIPHFPVTPVIIVGHICEKLCKPFKITPPIFPRRVDWYRQNRAFSIDKAKRDLGYAPHISIDEGLRRTAAWYREEGYL
ncbi:NAD-dependent epimerase/dehydratase family protein, partial [Crocinitomicaceae bacterium]|nr:NAD-dependent epimerase/dehydratase family protein [Crocinitomicaceae bacterium]